MWGKVFYSNDINELMIAQQNDIRVVVLDDDRDKYKRIGCYPMGILLPPFDALEAELNGDFNLSRQIYFDHLQSQYCSEAFGVILTALYAGKNIMIYIASDEARNLEFSTVFLDFIATVFGIVVSTFAYPNNGGISNQPNHAANRMNVMYLTGNIPFEVYVKEYPEQIYPDMLVCQKIAFSISPEGYGMMSPQELQYYCYSYIMNCKQIYANSQNARIVPIVYMKKEQS